jgi:hypothetical protein
MQHVSPMRRARAPVKLITFETQSRVDQSWQTVGVFDDRATAVAEAERLLDARRTLAVRVVQVLYQPGKSECREYTVFRATAYDEEGQKPRRRIDQEIFEWGVHADDHDDESAYWYERHWPSWAPDWATTALGLSIAVLAVSILFRWVK